MSKTTYEQMLGKLEKLEAFKGNSVTAINDGTFYTVLSYDTVMFSLNIKTKEAKYCSQKISRTTSKIQQLIRMVFNVDDADVLEYDNIDFYPMGIVM